MLPIVEMGIERLDAKAFYHARSET